MLCFRRKNFWGPSHGTSSRNGGGSGGFDSTSSSPAASASSGVTSGFNNAAKNGLVHGRGNKSKTMAPPPNVAHAVHPILREVTEDTPPDLLEGTMDLLVVLPSKKSVRMTVNRRTPMMDLLIQVTTANKINPGGHIVQVRNERGIELPYKPSTPIGALDTTTIDIVPKNQVNEYIIVKKQTAKIANQPFEQTFRLQVHLPRNQLYVMRVGPKTLLADILQEVCREKNLDYAKYEMRHPAKLDEKLQLDRRIGDFGLQEVTVVSRNSRINSSVSTADIMALQHEEGRTKGLDSAFKHSRSSVGDSSVSSESAASAASARGISPSRSDDSRSISPLPPIRPKLKLNATMSNASSSSGTSSAVPKSHKHHHPVVKTSTSLNSILQAPPRPKKRAAPLPPTLVSPSSSANPAATTTTTTTTTNAVNIPVSPVNDNNCIRQTTSVVTSPPIRPTPRKKDPPPKEPPNGGAAKPPQSLAINHSRHSSDSSGYHESCVVCDQDNQLHRFDRQQSVPVIGNLSNLPRVSGCHSVSNLTTVSSISSTSLTSSNGGQRKRKAPKPPTIPLLQAQKEIEEDIPISSSTTSLQSTASKSDLNQTLPITATNNNSNTKTTTSSSSSSSSPSSRPVSRESVSPSPLLSSNNHKKLLGTNSRETTLEVEVDVHAVQHHQESKVQEITLNLQEDDERLEHRIKKQQEEQQQIVKNSGEDDTIIKNRFEHHNHNHRNHHSTSSEPTSSLEESLPLSSASSLSSSPGSSQGSTSSSPIPTATIETETRAATAATEAGIVVGGVGAVVESSQVRYEKHSKSSSSCSSVSSSSKGSEGHLPSNIEDDVSSHRRANNLNSVQSLPSHDVPVENMSRPVSSTSSRGGGVMMVDQQQPTGVASRSSTLNNNTQALVNSSSSSSSTTVAASASASAAVPSAPPRKPRTPRAKSVLVPQPSSSSELNFGENDDENVVENSSLQQPKPKPRPRSRPRSDIPKSDATIDSGSQSNNRRETAAADAKKSRRSPSPPPRPIAVTTRNPLVNRIGVKVFPDNVLQEHKARISRGEEQQQLKTGHSSSAAATTVVHDASTSSPIPPSSSADHPPPIRYNKKARAPDPRAAAAAASVPRKIPATPSPSNLSNSSDTSSSTSSTTTPAKILSAQSKHTSNNKPDSTDSVKAKSEKISTNTSSSSSSISKSRKNNEMIDDTIQARNHHHQGGNSESDDLEDTDLELFELAGSAAGTTSTRKEDDRRDHSKISPLTKTTTTTTTSMTPSKRTAPIPTVTVAPAVDNVTTKSGMTSSRRINGPIKSDSSAAKILGGNDPLNGNDDDDRELEPAGNFERTVSDRYLEKKSSTYGKNGQQQQQGAVASGDSHGAGQKLKQQQKKSSLNRWQNNQSLHEIEVDDVHDIQEESVLLSESEASYTDSGIPATETITPSPIDIDMDRSEKDISSAGSSRRSSIHSLDHPENENALRQILQSKIEKEQEIIDKAFEGIDAALDNDDETTAASTAGDKDGARIVNNNFDFAQTPSMTNLTSNNKVTSATSSPNPHTSDDEEREIEDDGAFSSSSSNDEEKELKFSSSGAEDSLRAHGAANGGDSLTTTGKVASSKKAAAASATRKLPKSESFSHKSEFDVKMKRKLFSKEGKMSAMVKQSYVSSSDEDLTGAGKNHGGKKDQSQTKSSVGRTGSMQNLSSVNNNNNNASGGSSRGNQMDQRNQKTVANNNRRNSPPSAMTNDGGFRKANSVMDIQELDPDIAQNPELLASFRSELESQFEQWKEQFLQKHLAGSSSKSSSLDTDSEPTPSATKRKNEKKKEEDEVDQTKPSSILESTTTTKVKGDQQQQQVYNTKETVITTKAQVHLPKVIHSQEKTPSQEKPSPISHTIKTQELNNVSQSLVTTKTTTKELESVENSSSNESLDPEKPQIVQSVAPVTLTKSAKEQPSRRRQDSRGEDEGGVEKFSTIENIKQVPQVIETVTRNKQEMPVESIKDHRDRSNNGEAEEIVQLREKKLVAAAASKSTDSDDEPKIYRYTGPPTINYNLGTWGERPQRSVSVKRDNDYIMGMGQSKANEGRPTIGSVAKRIHSFVSPTPPPSATSGVGTPSLTKPVVVATAASNNNNNNNTSTNPAPPSRPKSIAAIYTMNAMSSGSTDSNVSSSNTKNSLGSPSSPSVPNVVSSWKQRMQQSEKERQNSHASLSSPQNSIDVSEVDHPNIIILSEQPPPPTTNNGASSTLEKKTIFENSNNNNNNNNSVNASSLPATTTTTVQNNNNIIINGNGNGNTQQQKAFKISSYGESRKVHPLASSFNQNQNSDNNNDSSSDYSSGSRPTSSLSLQRVPSNASTSNITISSMSDSTSSSPVPPSSTNSTNTSSSSLSEKKKFFQGVKPVESTGKEMPIPAQNLKGNIASIQKVFEQHQQQKINNGSLPGTGTNSTTSPYTSKESSPAPSIVFSSMNSNSSGDRGTPPSISSTMMVQKVMKAGSFNVDNFRRTPSPSTSSLSSMSMSSKSENERYTPSPTEGAIRISTSTNRISTATGNIEAASRQQQQKQQQPVAPAAVVELSSGGGNIKNVGNKSIIIVGSSDLSSGGNNNIFKQQLKVTAAAPIPTPLTTTTNPVVNNSNHNNNNSTKVNINGAYNSNPNLKIHDKTETVDSSNGGGGVAVKLTGRENNVILKKTPTLHTTQETVPTQISTGKVSSIAANLTSNNSGFFSSLQRQSKQQQPEKVAPSAAKSMSNGDKPIIIEQLEKPRKAGVESNNGTAFTINNQQHSTAATTAPKQNMVAKGPSRNFEINKRNSASEIQAAGVGPPPPPPIPVENKLKPVSLNLSNASNNNSSSNGRSKSGSPQVMSPTSPSDPRSEIFDSIKNANFVLRKTNSTMLLK